MLELMKKYNELIERWKKAEKYCADESIEAQEKAKHNDKLIFLHDDIVRTQIQIMSEGYEMTADEFENGFRQIKYIM